LIKTFASSDGFLEERETPSINHKSSKFDISLSSADIVARLFIINAKSAKMCLKFHDFHS